MEKLDITSFMEEVDTPETRAYEHALDLMFSISEEMEKQNLTQRDLATRMDISEARLSKLFNNYTNMTLETIAKFEIALDLDLQMSFDTKGISQDETKVESSVAFSSTVNEAEISSKAKEALSKAKPNIFNASEDFDKGMHSALKQSKSNKKNMYRLAA